MSETRCTKHDRVDLSGNPKQFSLDILIDPYTPMSREAIEYQAKVAAAKLDEALRKEYNIPSKAEEGLTVAKLLAAQSALMKNDIEREFFKPIIYGRGPAMDAMFDMNAVNKTMAEALRVPKHWLKPEASMDKTLTIERVKNGWIITHTYTGEKQVAETPKRLAEIVTAWSTPQHKAAKRA